MDFDSGLLFLNSTAARFPLFLIRSRQIICITAAGRDSPPRFSDGGGGANRRGAAQVSAVRQPSLRVAWGQCVRLQFIPAGFAGEVRAGATCFHLKRADCRRHFLGGEPGKPGRPAKRSGEVTRIPVGKALAVERCPPIIDSIDEVWGYRCATAPASRACTASPFLPRAGCATLPPWGLRTGPSL